MSLTKLVGVIENGQVRLTENIKLPETGLVYVVFPERDNQPRREFHIRSPRLADPSRAHLYEKIVEPDDGKEYDEV